jgi:hypothetical protein
MTSARTIPRRELRPGIKRYADGDSTPAWDVYLDDRLVASEYVALADARMELDFALWYDLFGDAALNPDALITDEALGLAVQVFNRLFSAEKIQHKALTAREKIIAGGIYTIQGDGSLSVLASSGRGKQASYAITATSCTCKDFFTHAHLRGGVCKHIAARMLLVLAQHGVGYLLHLRDALDAQPVILHGITPVTAAPATTDAPDDASDAPTSDAPDLAFLSIGAADLAAAMFLAQRAGTAVEIHADNGTLRLSAGAITVAMPCLDGSETCSVRLEIDAFAALYEQLRPAVKQIGALTIFVSADNSIVLTSQDADFSAAAQGTAIPLPTPAPSRSTPETAPAAAPSLPIVETQTVDALQLLFGLLEVHEPEWYLRKHYRIAHDALTASGRLAAS